MELTYLKKAIAVRGPSCWCMYMGHVREANKVLNEEKVTRNTHNINMGVVFQTAA